MSIFDEILENKELGDDIEISLGDKTLKLGDLRSEYRETHDRASRLDAVSQERDAIRTERDTLSRNVGDLLAKAAQQTDDDARHQPVDSAELLRNALRPLYEKDDPSAALFEDKVFGGALTKAEQRAYDRAHAEIDAINARFEEQNKLVRDGFQALTNAQVAERENRWYDINRRDIPKGADGKPLTAGQIREIAVSRNLLVPGTRLLDYDAALEVVTEPTRREQMMSEAEKRGYEKGLAAGRTDKAKVLPLFGDRPGGAAGGTKVGATGQSARQIVGNAVAQGMADIASGQGE